MAESPYYKAHCSGCGEVTTADLLAFDFGKLINKAIEIQEHRTLGATDEWASMLQVDFALYLTWRDLQSEFQMRNGSMQHMVFTVDHLKEHIRRKTELDFDEIYRLPDTNNVIYGKLVNTFRPPFMQGETAKRQNVFDEDQAEKIRDVIGLIGRQSSDKPVVIAEFDVGVIFEKDDRGQEFPKKLQVKYEDGSVEVVTHNVCPNCGKEFYWAVGKHEETIIGLAGSARVGKTAYLAALVDRIQHGSQFLEIVEDNSGEWKFFRDNILRKYQAGEKIPKTPFEGFKETIPLFSLTIKILDRYRVFTFIDMPGEAYDSEDNTGNSFILNNRNIIQYAQMIWFCIAPEQIDSNVAILNGTADDSQDYVNTETSIVMTNIRQTMEAVCVNEKKRAAVLVTKSDLIIEQNNELSLFRPGTDEEAEYLWNGALNTQNALAFSARAGRYISQAKTITSSLNTMFDRYQTFAVAAYGQNVADTENTPDLDALGGVFSQNKGAGNKPSMIELPFLWMLAEEGIIEARHVIQFYRMKKVGRLFKKEEVEEDTRWDLERTPFDTLYQHYELDTPRIPDPEYMKR